MGADSRAAHHSQVRPIQTLHLRKRVQVRSYQLYITFACHLGQMRVLLIACNRGQPKPYKRTDA